MKLYKPSDFDLLFYLLLVVFIIILPNTDRAISNIIFHTFLAILLLCVLYIAFCVISSNYKEILKKHQQSRLIESFVVIPFYEPPSNIHPAIAGFLIDKKIGEREFFASLFNTIIDGHIVIDERIENNEYKYYFLKNKGFNEPISCDRLIYGYIFSNNIDSMSMKDIKISPDLFSYFVIDELVKLEYFENPYCISKDYLNLKNNPEEYEKKWIEDIDRAKFWSLVFSLGAEKHENEKKAKEQKELVREFIENSKKRPLKSFGNIFGGFKGEGLFYTQLGAEERAKWLGFKDYLQTAERFRLDVEKVETFSKYLPYAVALGVETQWTKRFEDMKIDRLEWFRSQKSEAIRRHDSQKVYFKHLIRFMGRIYISKQ